MPEIRVTQADFLKSVADMRPSLSASEKKRLDRVFQEFRNGAPTQLVGQRSSLR